MKKRLYFLLPCFKMKMVNGSIQFVQSLKANNIIGGGIAVSTSGITRAKSTQLKEIGKVELVPAIFNINEPLLFGLPIVYNVNLFVPIYRCPNGLLHDHLRCLCNWLFAKDYRATTLANASRPGWLHCYGFLERRGSCDRQRDHRLPHLVSIHQEIRQQALEARRSPKGCWS